MFNFVNSQRDVNEKLIVEEVDNFYNKAAKKSASGVPIVKSFLYLHSVIKTEIFCLRKCPSHVQKYMPAAAQHKKKIAGIAGLLWGLFVSRQDNVFALFSCYLFIYFFVFVVILHWTPESTPVNTYGSLITTQTTAPLCSSRKCFQ